MFFHLCLQFSFFSECKKQKQIIKACCLTPAPGKATGFFLFFLSAASSLRHKTLPHITIIIRVMKMNEVIYADVLVALNIYVTFALLSLTGIICRKKRTALRIIIASVISGLYSLIILLPVSAHTLTSITRIPFALVVVLTGFGFASKREFLRLSLCFFAVSFAFAGLMFFLWHFFSPKGMYYSNGIVYFDIDTLTLVLLTALCYCVLSFCNRYIRSRAPYNTIYDCDIYVAGESFCCHSFLDTGNSLKDPFTGNDVLIVTREKVSSILPQSDDELTGKAGISFRFIPCQAVTGEKMLLSFKSDRVHMKSLKADFVLENITVAVTDGKIKGGAFDAILPAAALEHTKEKEKVGASYEQNKRIAFKD